LKILIWAPRGLIFSIFHQNIENIDPGVLQGEKGRGHQGLPWEASIFQYFIKILKLQSFFNIPINILKILISIFSKY